MKIAIYGRTFNKAFSRYAQDLFKTLKDRSVEVIIFKPFYDFLLNDAKIKPDYTDVFTKETGISKDVDFMFCIGGDGTFLETITYVAQYEIPLVGINSGRLGFLANISKEEINVALDALFEEDYDFEYRTLIQLETHNKLFGEFNYALNELTILKKDSSAMITIHTYLNNEYLNSYWADGLILATPTGSTAYSLSVGGPIVLPNSQNFIISPIAPHALTVRPLVVPDKNTITLKVEGRGAQFLASLDHRTEVFDASAELTVTRAEFMIKILRLRGNSFFSTLRNKLMWGADKRN